MKDHIMDPNQKGQDPKFHQNPPKVLITRPIDGVANYFTGLESSHITALRSIRPARSPLGPTGLLQPP